MLRLYKMHLPYWLLLLAGIEISIIIASFFFGQYLSWVDFKGTPRQVVDVLPGAALYSTILFITLYSLGLYNRQNIRKYVESSIRISVSFLITLGILTALFYTLPILLIWRSVIMFAMITAFLGILTVRFAATRTIDTNLFKRRIAVIGVGEQATRIEALENTDRVIGFVCVGYLDFGGEQVRVPPSRVIPRVNSLIDFTKEERIDEIVIAVRDRRGHLPMPELIACQLDGVGVVDYMTFYACEMGKIDLEVLEPSWFLFSEGFRGYGPYRMLKRLIDITVSLALLIILMPIILLTAIAIWLERGGPILLRQERVGLNGDRFVLLKFRSMQKNAEGDGTPKWAAPIDPRVTTVGALLRRTHIDEIPQLINVITGEMSLVGPRPERPFFVQQLSQDLPFYQRRHSVKPGLTGWAQLYYPYAASIEDAKEKLEYDLYYVNYRKLFLDILIILQTLRIIIWPHGLTSGDRQSGRETAAFSKDVEAVKLVAPERRAARGRCDRSVEGEH